MIQDLKIEDSIFMIGRTIFFLFFFPFRCYFFFSSTVFLS